MSNRPNQRPQRSTSSRVAEARGATSGGNGLLIGGGVVVVLVLAILVAVFVGRSGDTASELPADDPLATAEPVSVSGESLPPLPTSGDDGAIGMAMPSLTGDDLKGQSLTIGPDGKPQMIVYLAHWCPHCQKEVPILVDWMKQGGNGEVEVRGVTTSINPDRPNYPPTSWLQRENWDVPTLLDPTGTAAEASGLTGFPYFIFLDADGQVTSRASGELTIEQIEEHLDGARAGATSTPGTVTQGPSSPAEG